MTSPPPANGPGQNPFDQGYQVYGGGGADNPLTNPGMFVRPAPPAPPPRRRSAIRNGLQRVAAGAAVSLLIAACCGGFRLLGITGGDDDKPKRSAATPTPTRSSASPSPSRTFSRPPSTAPASTAPAKPALDDVQKGQCLKNNGTNEDPDMVPAPCGKGTYQVLARYSGYIDVVCQNVPGYTTSYVVTYYRNGIPDSLRSYVLCLKRR